MADDHHGTAEGRREMIQRNSVEDVARTDRPVAGRFVIDVCVSEYLVLVDLYLVLGIRFIGWGCQCPIRRLQEVDRLMPS